MTSRSRFKLEVMVLDAGRYFKLLMKAELGSVMLSGSLVYQYNVSDSETSFAGHGPLLEALFP